MGGGKGAGRFSRFRRQAPPAIEEKGGGGCCLWPFMVMVSAALAGTFGLARAVGGRGARGPAD